MYFLRVNEKFPHNDMSVVHLYGNRDVSIVLIRADWLSVFAVRWLEVRKKIFDLLLR